MTQVTRAANAAAAAGFTGRWTDPSNAYGTSADSSYATVTNTSKSVTYGDDYGFPDFGTGDIPDGATINSVTLDGYWGFAATLNGSVLGCQPRLNGANAGTEATFVTQSSSSTFQATFSTLPTLAQLRSASTLLKARIRATRPNSSAAQTFQLDFVSVTVDWTAGANPPTPQTVGPSAITPAGVLGRLPKAVRAGALTFAAGVSRLVSRGLPAAGLTPAGALVRSVTRSLSGALTFAADLVGILMKRLTLNAAITPAVTFVRSTARALAASLSPAATLSRVTSRTLAAGLSASAALARTILRPLTASLTATGSLVLRTSRSLAGALSFSTGFNAIKGAAEVIPALVARHIHME